MFYFWSTGLPAIDVPKPVNIFFKRIKQYLYGKLHFGVVFKEKIFGIIYFDISKMIPAGPFTSRVITWESDQSYNSIVEWVAKATFFACFDFEARLWENKTRWSQIKKIYWSSNNLKSKLRKNFFFRTYNLELESNNFQNAIIYLLPGFSLVNSDNKGMQMIFDL